MMKVEVKTPIPPKEQEEKKEVGIKQRLEEINEKVDMMTPKSKETKSKFKLPWGVKSKLKQLEKKDKLLVFLLKNNRTITPMIKDIVNQRIEINGAWRDCSVDFVFLWQGKHPSIIMPEWDILPIGTKDFYESDIAHRSARAEKVIIDQFEAKENQMPNKLGGKMWIWILLGAAVLAYIIFGGGK